MDAIELLNVTVARVERAGVLELGPAVKEAVQVAASIIRDQENRLRRLEAVKAASDDCRM